MRLLHLQRTSLPKNLQGFAPPPTFVHLKMLFLQKKKKKKKKKTGTAESLIPSFLGPHFGGATCSEVWGLQSDAQEGAEATSDKSARLQIKSSPSLYPQEKDRGGPRGKSIGKFLSVCWHIFNSLGNLSFCFPSRKLQFQNWQAHEIHKMATKGKCCPDTATRLKVFAPTSVQVNIT